MEHNTELHENAEVVFEYDGEDLVWIGDIEVIEEIEKGDYDTPDYSEVYARIYRTTSLQRYNESTGDWEDVEMDSSIMQEIQWQYEKTL
jgi:hypothetical protein